MGILSDWIKFIRNIVIIVKTWFVEFFTKNALKNAWWLGASFVLWFMFSGSFWTFWGWACFWIFVGINLSSFSNIYKELRFKYGW